MLGNWIKNYGTDCFISEKAITEKLRKESVAKPVPKPKNTGCVLCNCTRLS